VETAEGEGTPRIVNLRVENVTEESVTFEWDEGGDEPADIYQVLRSFDGSFFVELETGPRAQVLRAMRRAVHGLTARSPARTLSVPTPGPFNTTYKTVTGLVEHHQYAFQIFAGTISNDGITIDWDTAAHQRLVKTLIKRTHSRHTAWIVNPVAHTVSAGPIHACRFPRAQRRVR